MENALKYSDVGPKDGPILFFIHGWPDTGELWEKQVQFFSNRYRCICVTLPSFRPGDPAPGVDFPTLVEKLHATVQAARGDAATAITIVGHDWGASLTYLLDQRYPDLAKNLITMDVGANFKPGSLGHVAYIIGYQSWLAAAYWVGKIFRAVGNAMTRKFARWAEAPAAEAAHYRMNYVYYFFWKAKIFKPRRKSSIFRLTKPILFIYGGNKKYNFHDYHWEAAVNTTPGSRFIGFEHCDHWLMVRDPAATNEAMKNWLVEREATSFVSHERKF
jgi:pimeloyl-ACP methyl ester carboxylesterase